MKNSEKYLNRVTNKGITLIALVISVVVILILLTITINLALGDRGLLTESEGTKKDSIVSLYEKEIAAKIVKREVIEEITDAILEEILSNYGNVQYDENESPSGVVTKEGYLIEVEYIWSGKVKDKTVAETPEITKPTEETTIQFTKAYGVIDIVWLDTNNNVISDALSPASYLGGLTPVKWTGTAGSYTETTTTTSDTDWYSYTAQTSTTETRRDK